MTKKAPQICIKPKVHRVSSQDPISGDVIHLYYNFLSEGIRYRELLKEFPHIDPEFLNSKPRKF